MVSKRSSAPWILWVLFDASPGDMVLLDRLRSALEAGALPCDILMVGAEGWKPGSPERGLVIASPLPPPAQARDLVRIVVATRDWHSRHPTQPTDRLVDQLSDLPELAGSIAEMIRAMSLSDHEEAILTDRLRKLGYL